MASARPTRTVHPSAKLLSADNGGEIELSFHCKAIAKHNTLSTSLESTRNTTADLQSGLSSDSPEPLKSTPTTRQSSCDLSDVAITRQSTERDTTVTEPDDIPFPRINKRRIVESEPESNLDSQPTPSLQQKKKRTKAAGKSKGFALIRLHVDGTLNS